MGHLASLLIKFVMGPTTNPTAMSQKTYRLEDKYCHKQLPKMHRRRLEPQTGYHRGSSHRPSTMRKLMLLEVVKIDEVASTPNLGSKG
jgi:hypothetical protein